MKSPILEYDKYRKPKSSASPRDIQNRQNIKRTGSSSDESVLALKETVLELKEQVLELKSNPNTKVEGYTGKLYTEDEFNAEVIKALEKELASGSVGKGSVEVKQLEEQLKLHMESSSKKVNDLEGALEARLTELIELKSKTSVLEALLGAKDQTITALQNKPIVVNGVAGVVSSEPKYDVPDIEAETIDPTDSDVKLESFISVAEVKDTSGSDMVSDMSKLKDIMNGGF